MLDNTAYLIDDVDAKTKTFTKAKINPSGSLGNIKASTPEELEKALVSTKIPKRVFIKDSFVLLNSITQFYYLIYLSFIFL